MQAFFKLDLVNQYLKDIIKISWPIIIGQLGMVFTGFFDTLMVGQLGTVELAAAGISNSIFFFVAIFPLGVTMAFATIIGILQGKNKTSSYHLLARDSFIVTLVLSVLASLVIVLFIHHFYLFEQTEEVTLLTKPYLKLLMWSLTPMLVFFFAKNICDGFSFTLGGMIVTITALILNVFLNWVLIFGKLGFDAYGLNGAGYATIISRIYLAFGMMALLFWSNKIPISLEAFLRGFVVKSRVYFYKKIITLGLPTGLQYFFEIAAFAGAAIMAGWLGAKELAAHNLAITLASVTYMFAGGISAGASICVAKADGNKNLNNVYKYGLNGHLLGLIVMSVFAIMFFSINTELAALFSEDREVIKLGAQLLILAAIFQLGDGIQAVSVGILRGISDVQIPSIIVFVAYWIIAMPIGYWVANKTNPDFFYHGVNGIWVGLTIGLTLSAITLSYRFYLLIRRS